MATIFVNSHKIAIDVCSTTFGGCGYNSRCSYESRVPVARCSCNAGYSSASGTSFQDCLPINNCATNNGGCGVNSHCYVLGPGTSACVCFAGFKSASAQNIDCTESAGAAASSALSSSVIAGITIGAIGFIVIVSILVLVLIFTKRRKNQPQNFEDMVKMLTVVHKDGKKKVPREIKRVNIKIFEVVGKGNFGEVSKGLLSEIPGVLGYIVAIKSLHDVPGANRTEILEEAALMAQFDHPYVTGLIGVVTIGAPLLVVMEYCEHGSFNHYLAKNDLANHVKVMLAADCADGLAYLASIKLVHRDVAARNVLVSSERRAKIADFGMSRETVGSDYYRSKGGQLPIRWTAPEALEEQKFSEKSDVWSYGVLLHEIWTKAELPYKDMDNRRVWVEVLAGYRLPCPPGCPQEIHALMLQCWQEPQNRPTFDTLRVAFRKMEEGDFGEATKLGMAGGKYKSALEKSKPAEASSTPHGAVPNPYVQPVRGATEGTSGLTYMDPDQPVNPRLGQNDSYGQHSLGDRPAAQLTYMVPDQPVNARINLNDSYGLHPNDAKPIRHLTYMVPDKEGDNESTVDAGDHAYEQPVVDKPHHYDEALDPIPVVQGNHYVEGSPSQPAIVIRSVSNASKARRVSKF